MNINYKEPQFELFPANSATLEDINKPKFLLATLTLSTESLVILGILTIMIGLFSFSIGVEQGKRLAAQSLDEKVAAAWSVGGRRLAVAPVVKVVPAAAPATTLAKNGSNPGAVRAVYPVHQIPATPKVAVAKAAIVKLPAVAAISSGKWSVQVATYKSENYAQKEALGLKAKGYPVMIVKSKGYYLVSMGPFSSQSQADSFTKKIQAKYPGSQVRRI